MAPDLRASDTSRLRSSERGGAHGHAVAGRPRVAGLGAQEVLHRHLTGADRLGELPDMGAGADLLAFVVAVQHRPAGHADGDRKSVVEGKSVSVSVDPGGRRSLKKKTRKCKVRTTA